MDMDDVLARMSAAEELAYINPGQVSFGESRPSSRQDGPAGPAAGDCGDCGYDAALAAVSDRVRPGDIDEAELRLRRFAPLIAHYFPETKEAGGMIESPLAALPGLQARLGVTGRLMIKLDSHLAVAGSVKARGGIYEVLVHTERLALEAGLLSGTDDDYMKLVSEEARRYFSGHKVQVGSTGNLGMSIGIMSAAIGYQAIVHMSADAKQWKKDLLRSRGAEVIEYEGDYSSAVAEGRRLSALDPASYFVDDEHSVDLFVGYASAGARLRAQLDSHGIPVDGDHPLRVYIPCGVGGAPGGITYGLKRVFGDHVQCYFAEPVQAPCMLLGLVTEKYDAISVQDIGLTGKTEADGLACPTCSGLSAGIMASLLAGEATADDHRLYYYMKELFEAEGIFIEPSSCAAFQALMAFHDHAIPDKEATAAAAPENVTHIIWATGGSFMPQEERDRLLK